MSIICKKSYTISSASVPPFAYYKMDTIVGAPAHHTAPDSMPLALDMNNSNATATAVAGKIGNAWSWSGSAGRLASAAFTFTGTSFLIRMWLRALSDVPGWGFNIWTPMEDGASYRLRFYPFFWGFFPRFYALNAGEFIQSTVALDGTWRRVIVAYNDAANEISIQVDQNAADTLVLSASMGAGSPRFDMAGVLGGLCEIDEIGFWKGTDALWSPAQYLDDWNGGAGKTYP